MWILDTDHLSLLQRENSQLIERLSLHQQDRVVITIVTAEEQLRGRLSVISKASDPKSKTLLSLAYQNLRLTIESLQEFEQIDFDLEAESIYHQLRQQKIRIGTQDLRIASIVLANQATLLTRNYRDFSQVPNLIIDDWARADRQGWVDPRIPPNHPSIDPHPHTSPLHVPRSTPTNISRSTCYHASRSARISCDVALLYRAFWQPH